MGAILAAVLIAAAFVRAPGLADRPITYDEAVSLLQVSGRSVPEWPSEPTPARKLKTDLFSGTASLQEISGGVQRTDVHPAGYYWALAVWRRWFGSSLEAARGFSLVCSLGAVGVLFLFLGRAGYTSPTLPTAVYALSASAVYYGYEARPYALASVVFMTGVLLAYVSSEAHGRGRRTFYAFLAGAILGLAFDVHYLTLFPSCVVLIWLVLRGLPGSWKRAIAACLGFLVMAALSLPTLAEQVGSRAHQLRGFVGVGAELQALFVQNLLVAWAPTKAVGGFAPAVYVGLLGLVLWTGRTLWRSWPTEKRRFWLLVGGLVVAPSLGVLTLDVAFDRQLHRPRFLMYAGPFLSVLLAHGIVRFSSKHKKLGSCLFTVLLVVLWIPGWDSNENPMLGYPKRQAASWIGLVEELDNVAVAVGTGNGRGDPAVAVHKLGSLEAGDAIDVLAINAGGDIERLATSLRPYSHVWVVEASDGRTASEEQHLVDLLSRSPGFLSRSRVGPATHFLQVTSSR